eukprot:1145188-Pelagomonas_calceolata.AAC.5
MTSASPALLKQYLLPVMLPFLEYLKGCIYMCNLKGKDAGRYVDASQVFTLCLACSSLSCLLRDLEVEGLDLDTDVAGNETRSLERAEKLINAIHSIELRTDVLNWIGPEVRALCVETNAAEVVPLRFFAVACCASAASCEKIISNAYPLPLHKPCMGDYISLWHFRPSACEFCNASHAWVIVYKFVVSGQVLVNSCKRWFQAPVRPEASGLYSSLILTETQSFQMSSLI